MKRRKMLSAVMCFLLYAVSFGAEIWIMPNGANPKGVLRKELSAFTEKTGIEVKIKVLDWGEAWSKINKALKEGTGPDVVQLGTTWCSDLSNQGLLADLTGYSEEINTSRFLNTSMATTSYYNSDKIYGIPWFVDARVLMGNKRYLDTLGITADDISTWQGFVKALKRIRESDLTNRKGSEVYPFSFPGKEDWNIPHNFAPWIWSEGGSFIRRHEGDWVSGILDENTVIGIRKYISFVLDTLINRETLKENTAGVAQRFNNGELVFIINSPEIIMQTSIPDSLGGLKNSAIGKDGISTFRIPEGEGGSVAFVGGSNLCIPSGKESDEAVELLKFLTSSEALKNYTSRIGFLPPDKRVLDEMDDPVYETLMEAAETGKAYPSIPEWGDIEQILIKMFTSVWEIVDVRGMYSDKELYNVLTEYNKKIEKELGIEEGQGDTLGLEAFMGYIQSFKQQKEKTELVPEKRKPSSPYLVTGKEGLYMLIALFLVVLAAIALAIHNKKQEQKKRKESK